MSGYLFYYIDPAGFEFAINDQVNCFLLKTGLRGFNGVKSSTATQRAPYTDGEERLGRIYTPARQLGIPLSVLAADGAAWSTYVRTLRHNLSAYKDPEAAGILKVVTPDAATRYIDAWLTNFGDPEMDGPLYGKFVIEFASESAFFYDPTLQTITCSVSGPGGISFPITFPITFSSTAIDQHVSVANTGDVETWPTIRINGPGVNPTIENETTGLTMALTKTLDVGDYVDIDMDAATINWYDASAGTTTSILDLMSAGSSFWNLRVGDNTIHVTMSSAYSGSVIFSYYLYYQGV